MEGWRDEQAKGEVEQPVRDTGDGHAVGTCLQRPNLRCVHPCDWCQSERVDDDQEIRKRDNRVCWPALAQRDNDVEIAVNTTWNVLTIGSKDAADNEVANTHAYGTEDEQRTTTSKVDEEEGEDREHDEKSVLNSRANQVNVASETSHGENVDHVVHLGHIISPCTSISKVENEP